MDSLIDSPTNTSNERPIAELREENSKSATFVLMAIVMFLLFFRPHDLFPPLKFLHLPMIFSLICIGTHIVSSLSNGQSIFRLTPLTKALAGLTLWALVGVPFAYWSGGALSTFILDWSKMVLLYLILANGLTTVKQVRILITVCVLCATATSLMAIIGYIVNGGNLTGRLVALVNGPYSGSNYFSVTVLLMLPYPLFDMVLDTRLSKRIFAFAVAGILGLANLLTESRAGILGMLLVGAAFIWTLRKWGKSLFRMVTVILLVTPLLLIVIPQGVWDRFSTLFNDYDVQQMDPTDPLRMAAGSQKERVQLLFKAISLTFDHPVFGVGMGDFSTASAHMWSTGTGRDWIQTHNTYLQFSSELGLPGLLLYLYALRLTFKGLKQARKRLPKGKRGSSAYRLGLLCDATVLSLLGYSLVSAFANVGYQPYYFFAAGIAQAIARVSARVTVTAPAPVPEPTPVMWELTEAKA